MMKVGELQLLKIKIKIFTNIIPSMLLTRLDTTTCSASSTCLSSSSAVETPEPLNCRGIINPNYPGFQHLAHTLSEHFFDEHHFANSSEDSDLSEIETEHSDESTSNTKERPGATKEHCDTLNKIEEIIRGAFKSSDEDEHPTLLNGRLSPVSGRYFGMDDCGEPTHPEEDDEEIEHGEQEDDDEEIEADEEEEEGEDDEDEVDDDPERSHYISYKMLESSGEPSLEATHIAKHAVEFDIDCTDATRQRTPDILKKTSSVCMSAKLPAEPSIVQKPKPVIKPDILLNVHGFGGEAGSEEVEEDIVGNFELEVEHELGRVVSGYRSVMGGDGDGEDDGSDCDLLLQDNVQQVQQTIECLMSNAEKMERSLKKVSTDVMWTQE